MRTLPARTIFACLCVSLFLLCLCAMYACQKEAFEHSEGADDTSTITQLAYIDATGKFTGSTLKAGTLTVLTCADYEPMEYKYKGSIIGFDIALISEIASKLGLQPAIHDHSFASLIDALASGKKADLAISALTINDARAKIVDFSDPYFDSNLAVVVSTDSSFVSEKDLNKAKIKLGSQAGSTGQQWAKSKFNKAKHISYKKTPKMLRALKKGHLDAVVYDEAVAQKNIKSQYSDFEIFEIVPTGEHYGIAVNKDNPLLTAAINDLLATFKADGTIDRLRKENIG